MAFLALGRPLLHGFVAALAQVMVGILGFGCFSFDPVAAFALGIIAGVVAGRAIGAALVSGVRESYGSHFGSEFDFRRSVVGNGEAQGRQQADKSQNQKLFHCCPPVGVGVLDFGEIMPRFF